MSMTRVRVGDLERKTAQSAHRVDGDHLGPERPDRSVHRAEMGLEPKRGRTGRDDPQEAFRARRLEVHADRLHVANYLLGRLLEREQQRTFAACASCLQESRPEARLAAPG
jgi:hypothetical protein